MATKKLTKAVILRRLQNTVKKLKALPNAKFNYESYVSESETDTNGNLCGTVCCVVGWYPKWFPESEIRWSSYGSLDSPIGRIQDKLKQYHGISLDLVNVLFYGCEERFNLNKPKTNSSILNHKFINIEMSIDLGIPHSSPTRKEVIQLFELVINLIKNDIINYR